MTTIIKLEEIRLLLENIDVIEAMKKGFIAYSNGLTVVPPVGELLFEEPKGEMHLKYGYIKGDDYYCVKIASGFAGNRALGITSSQGMMLLFSQKTGQSVAVLLDEGYLTDIRTAAAGALAAQYFAPKKVKGIGIVGTGLQANFQLEFLLKNQTCKTVWVWGRNVEKAREFADKWKSRVTVHIAKTTAELAQHCNLIVTTTPAHTPLLHVDDIQAGTHITAMGSDTADKQELDSHILAKADLIISDSIPQSKSRGEIYRATKEGCINHSQVVELGHALQNPNLQRTNEEQISIVDLTGVAVQDIMISEAVYTGFIKKENYA